ncbi:MAG: YitT family protein [Clostridia bacterium]|nr:YitT family protein [Clostridia bacterium]
MPEKNPKLKIFRDYVLMTAGTVLMTVGVYFFKIPNGFSTGGVSGIGTLLGKITPVTPATWISILNVVLLLLGFAVLGRETGMRTVYCSLLFSGLTQALEWIVPLGRPLTDQPFLELAYAMILTAFGSALIFHSQASSGGTDIVALILKKYSSLNVGMALLCVDFLIAACSFVVFDVRTGLFSLAGLFAKAFLVDSVIENLDACKYFVVITTREHAEDISAFILTSLHHGATVEFGQGAFTHEDKIILHTVCRRSEAPSLQRRIREVDPSAFIIITTSSEIIGRGFRGVL